MEFQFSWAVSNPKIWCCESAELNMSANLENSAVAWVSRAGKHKFSFQFQRKDAKEWSNHLTKWAQNWASKVMLKILQARLQQYMNCRIPNVQAGFRDLEKVEEPEIKLSLKKHESCRKTSTSALLTVPNLWLCGSQQTVENSERDRNTRPPDLPPEKSLCRSRSNS